MGFTEEYKFCRKRVEPWHCLGGEQLLKSSTTKKKKQSFVEWSNAGRENNPEREN